MPYVVSPHAGVGAEQELGTQEQAPPVLLQEPPQLSTPLVVCSHAGVDAEQEPSGTQEQLPPVLLHELPQLSTPVVVAPHAGVSAEQEPFGTQTASSGVTVTFKRSSPLLQFKR